MRQSLRWPVRAMRASRHLFPAIIVLMLPCVAVAQARSYPLESAAGLRLHNVQAAAVAHEGKRGVRVTISDEAQRRVAGQPVERQSLLEKFALIDGTDFGDGVIEAEVAGAPAPDAPEGARGFVGIAFRVQPDLKTYDAFYLRPTNARASDQVRRNHSVQYISHPDWTWNRLRQESPKKYETYVDLVPGAWTRIRIEVRGDTARLYVHGREQPTLVVTDVKTGARARGGVALWIDAGTVAHFRNVRVRSSAGPRTPRRSPGDASR